MAATNATAATDPEPLPEADGFPDRAVKDLLNRQGVTQAEFVKAHPGASCFSTLWHSTVCGLVKQAARDECIGSVACSSIGFVFTDAGITSARMTASEAVFSDAYQSTEERLGDPEIQSHPLEGICTSMQTATFDATEARVQFEYMDCGTTARMYGQQQAIIVSLKTPG